MSWVYKPRPSILMKLMVFLISLVLTEIIKAWFFGKK